MKNDIAIEIANIKKIYKLGQIGGGTLQGDLQSWWARIRGKEDPNSIIGSDQRSNGKTFMALNGIDLTIKKGEAVGIIGHNGAGKSTLLKLLCRVTAPTEGEIGINGRITSMLEVGTGFNGEMTGRENVYMNGAILGMTRAEVDSKMEDIIEFSEVREFIDTPVKRYSSGMYVKLAFSVAAHLDSEIMIMDEVLAVGDMAFQKKCLDKMREAASLQGRTVLYVSHNMNTIRQLCDRCVVLDQGKVIFDGDVDSAIGIYMGNRKELKTKYAFQDSVHSNGKSKDYFYLKSLEFPEIDEALFHSDEIVRMNIACSSQKSIENLYLRLEIQYSDGTIAGTALSENGCPIKAGQNNVLAMYFDLSHLTPGIYKADIVAYEVDSFGEELYLDGVYPGMYFEIEGSAANNLKMEWNHRYWGHIRMHDLRLETIC